MDHIGKNRMAEKIKSKALSTILVSLRKKNNCLYLACLLLKRVFYDLSLLYQKKDLRAGPVNPSFGMAQALPNDLCRVHITNI